MLARYGRVYICQGLSGRVIPQVGDPTVHRPYVRGVHLPSGVCVWVRAKVTVMCVLQMQCKTNIGQGRLSPYWQWHMHFPLASTPIHRRCRSLSHWDVYVAW